MAYPLHYLLQFGGTVGTTDPEIWSSGIRMWSSDFQGFDEDDYFDTVAIPALSDWVARVNSRISNYASLDFAKFNAIGPDGKYTEPTTREHFYSPVVVGGATTSAPLPWQACVVLSWRTNNATRGRASKGRIYSPAPSVAISAASGLFAGSMAGDIATSAALLLNTLDIGFGVDSVLRPCIISGLSGVANQIDTVIVDNRVDIQRRRANSLVPASSSAPVLY